MRSIPVFAFAILLFNPGAVLAQDALEREVESILAEAGPGTRWGLVVADADGNEVIAIDPEKRFIPASNTKLFTTVATIRAQALGELPETGDAGARVRIEGKGRARDVVLEGRGDPHLSAAPDCTRDCLATLADAVAARTSRVRNVIGDATAFPDERWSPGMSWNNIPTRSGTGIAALLVDENELGATVTADTLDAPPAVTMPAYFTVRNLALTVPGDVDEIGYDRAPGGREVVVTGTIGVDAPPRKIRLGVDDPAHYAAWLMAKMLRERGVRVTGEVLSRHRPLLPSDDPKSRGEATPVKVAAKSAIATLAPPPLNETVRTTNKVSQNLYAELLLRRLGCIRGTCSIADGQASIAMTLVEAGVDVGMVSLSDGSGMSTYNRVTPRAATKLLGWAARQPWGADFRATLPIGGIDGTLARRFAETPLAGRIFAKTGSLNATSALAGYMIAASGRELTFAIYANDVPENVRANPFMDRALLAIAAAN
jgi:D-alanyl-D-alanine carboxypeptidase/D-alanyl-D-alanine-endopeptidase (penicillin-binding protein 4)